MITEWSSFLRIIQYWNLGGVPEKPQNGEFQELPYRSIFQMADRVDGGARVQNRRRAGHIRYPPQGKIMRHRAFGRFCEYLGRIAYPPNFVGRPTGPFGGFLASFVTGRRNLDSRLALQAPDCTEKYGSPQSNAWQSIFPHLAMGCGGCRAPGRHSQVPIEGQHPLRPHTRPGSGRFAAVSRGQTSRPKFNMPTHKTIVERWEAQGVARMGRIRGVRRNSLRNSEGPSDTSSPAAFLRPSVREIDLTPMTSLK